MDLSDKFSPEQRRKLEELRRRNLANLEKAKNLPPVALPPTKSTTEHQGFSITDIPLISSNSPSNANTTGTVEKNIQFCLEYRPSITCKI